MFYVIFHNGRAVGMTAQTRYALGQYQGAEWEIEAHDDWPEQRTGVNLLEMDFENVPENVGRITAAELMYYRKEEGKND